jgi:hypothetical protein|tara:strand:+ start:402 stop:1628 length:1227 start_codon:yes stop_codon:yes gene_type:complete
MSLKDAFLFNLESETHLRDARHANQIYTQSNFAFAPKSKYMYHVRFDPHPDVGNSADSNVFRFQKELGVLVKSADLPSFRASIENKQQYNRKKNIQTRVDYQDCRIAFHDDNTGVTRALLEEYYRYYFVDANKNSAGTDTAYSPRDKYFKKVPSYGLDNRKKHPFFKSITIYQLARRDWVAYTLVNPLLSAWDHGEVTSDGSDFNENTITVAYEAVHYSSGNVANDAPAGFADQSVGYDVTPSPLGYLDDAMIPGGGAKGLLPALIGLGTSALLNKAFGNTGGRSRNILKDVATGVIGGVVSNVLSQNILPVPDSQNKQESVTSTSNNSRILSSAVIVQNLAIPSIASQISPALVNSGALSNTSINDYNAANATQKAAYDKQISDKIEGGDQKLTQVASNAINSLGGT